MLDIKSQSQLADATAEMMRACAFATARAASTSMLQGMSFWSRIAQFVCGKLGTGACTSPGAADVRRTAGRYGLCQLSLVGRPRGGTGHRRLTHAVNGTRIIASPHGLIDGESYFFAGLERQ